MNEKDKLKLNSLLESLQEGKETFIGYPVNTIFDYSEISDFLFSKSIVIKNTGTLDSLAI